MSKRKQPDAVELAVPVAAADHALGLETAPVTLVEYGDFECPHCGAAHPILKELLARMGKEIRFVFRNFPIASIHPHATQAAEAAEAAAAQGRFWEMHDALFENQTALGDRELVTYAEAVGVKRAQFVRELSSHAHAAKVREDFMGGVRSGVNGTPTFFINGLRHDDSFDLPTLRKAIQRAAE